MIGETSLAYKQARESLHNAKCHADILHSIEKNHLLLCVCVCLCFFFLGW